MEEMISSSSLIMALGPATGVFFLSIYFIRTFVNFQKESIGGLINEMKADREQNRELMTKELEEFKDAVQKIDNRLYHIERSIGEKNAR